MRSAAYSHAKMAKVSRYKCTGIKIFSCRSPNQPVYIDMAQERSQVF